MAKIINTITTISHDTKANWNKFPTFVPQKGELIVYSDWKTKTDENGNTIYIPGIKFGDGNAYLIDIPFANEADGIDILNEVEAKIAAMMDENDEDSVPNLAKRIKLLEDNKLTCRIEGTKLVFNQGT